MEPWQIIFATVGAILAIGTAMARDRTLTTMISGTRGDWERAISIGKDDCQKMLAAQAASLDARITRVQESYVRRDDQDRSEQRMAKQFDDIRNDMRHSLDSMNTRLDEITKLLQGRA